MDSLNGLRPLGRKGRRCLGTRRIGSYGGRRRRLGRATAAAVILRLFVGKKKEEKNETIKSFSFQLNQREVTRIFSEQSYLPCQHHPVLLR